MGPNQVQGDGVGKSLGIRTTLRVIAGKLYTAKKVRTTKGAAVLRNESRAMQGEWHGGG